MDEEQYDVIIVGGGIAGATAALLLATEGLQVIVIERGNYSGAKNMTGGRLYSHSLENIIPDFASKAPVERKVTHERISMMTDVAVTTMDYASESLAEPGCDSYTVLRGVFDRWLMDQAEEAGAMPVPGICVDDFVYRDEKVAGIIAGGEEMLAKVVILADGANSLLIEKCGLRKKIVTPHQIAVGAKEIIQLDEKTIEDRFNLNPDEGMAWLFAGFPSDGKIGGGLIYTNKDTISLGVVATLSEFEKEGKSIHEMMEGFKNHPAMLPILKGGKLVEYSGHMVPEGGYDMVPTLYDNGVLVTGDAAGLVINVGYSVRGMDLAIGSAKAAAEAVIEAHKKDDFSAKSLSKYKELLDSSFVIKELKHFRKFPNFMDNPRVFNDYPQMMDEIMASLFVINGSNPKSIISKMIKPVRKVGIINLMKDGVKGVRAL